MASIQRKENIDESKKKEEAAAIDGGDEVIDLCNSSSDEENDDGCGEAISAIVIASNKRKGPPSPVNTARAANQLLHARDTTTIASVDNSSCNNNNSRKSQCGSGIGPSLDVLLLEEAEAVASEAAAAARGVSPETAGHEHPYEEAILPSPPPPPRLILPQDNAVITYGILPLLHQVQPTFCTQSRSLQHIQQLDKWSCGFRNLQMLLSALVPRLTPSHGFFQSLQHIYNNLDSWMTWSSLNESAAASILVLPSLWQLQEQLERSWNAGFDPRGATHFSHSVVGRPSEIGAVEVAYVLGFWSVDACVIQFLKCAASRQCLPAFVYHYFTNHNHQQTSSTVATTTTTSTNATTKERAEECVKWAEQHSKSQPPAAALRSGVMNEESVHYQEEDSSLPMYLQWEGHSVTVIGIEPNANANNNNKCNSVVPNWSQMNLLVLDPLRKGANMTRGLQQQQQQQQQNNTNNYNSNMAAIRLPCHRLLTKDCQLVLLGPTELTEAQRQTRKVNLQVVSAAKEEVMTNDGP